MPALIICLSQATFYRQFRDKYDLIAWSYTQDLERLLDQVRDDRHLWRQTLDKGRAADKIEETYHLYG